MRPDIDIRSYLDTRGALIMGIVSVVTLLGFAALGGLLQPLVMPDETADVELTVIALSLPLSLIIPVVAVLITAGEWSDRSLQITLTQRASRTGVMLSKTVAALAVVVGLVAASLALAALATWFGGEVIGNGAVFASMDRVWTVQLSVLLATFLFSVAMGLVTQSTVLGLLAAIGLPFVVSTAGAVASMTGSGAVVDVVRALDLQTASVQFGEGDAGAFELLPVLLLIVLPAIAGAWRWNRREVG